MDIISKMIAFLLDNANPSIVYRIKKEILKEPDSKETKQLQMRMLEEQMIKTIFSYQKENGWIGTGLHTREKKSARFENQETAVKYLTQKGLEKDHPVLKRAMDAFATVPLTDSCYQTRGMVYDEFQYTAFGMNLVRCACIARAGYHDRIDIEPQIQLSLDSFHRVLEVDSVLDVSRSMKKRRVFHDYEKWPCRYHLDILAHTGTWKSVDNIKMLAKAMKKLMRTDRPEFIDLNVACWIGHAINTLGGFAEGFRIDEVKHNTHDIHFEYLEWLARCGLVKHINQLQDTVEIIMDSIDEEGICRLDFDEKMFKGWGAYGGLRLEEDWKSPLRKSCDLTFRALLIIYYSELYEKNM